MYSLECLSLIGHFQKYHNTLCLSSKILHKHCFYFLLGLTIVSRENKNNAYAKFWRTNKEYYGIFESDLLAIFVYDNQPIAFRASRGTKSHDKSNAIIPSCVSICIPIKGVFGSSFLMAVRQVLFQSSSKTTSIYSEIRVN